MRIFRIVTLIVLVVFSFDSCTERKQGHLKVKVIKVLTNYPISGSPDWYHPPPTLEFIIEVENPKDHPIVIPINLREDFNNRAHAFFDLIAGCEKFQSRIFLYSPTGTKSFIEIEAHGSKHFSLLTRFQQLNSLYEKCDKESVNEFLFNIIKNGKITFTGKDGMDVLQNGNQFEVIKKLHVVKSQKIEIIEPSNLLGARSTLHRSGQSPHAVVKN